MPNLVVRTFHKYPTLSALLAVCLLLEGVALADQIIDHSFASAGQWRNTGRQAAGGPYATYYSSCLYEREPDECIPVTDPDSFMYDEKCSLVANGHYKKANTWVLYNQACPTGPTSIDTSGGYVNGATTIYP